VFDESFSFHVTAFDDPQLGPFWKDRFPIDKGSCYKFGWIVVNGERLPLRHARTLTRYNPKTLFPESIDIHVEDARGASRLIKGTITAAAPFTTWHNNRAPICMTRWECDGRVGWGELQQVQGNDFLHAYLR
jgi:hypothetical protein